MKIKCRVCGYEWDYTGKKKVNASCPDCGNKTPIPNGEVKKND